MIEMYKWLISNYIVDSWTIIHFMFFGSLVLVLPQNTKWLTVIVISLTVGLMWEVIELYLEIHIFGWREPFWNKWGTDPLADVLGALFYFKVLRRRLS